MVKIRLPIKKKETFSKLLNYIYRSAIPMLCGMLCVFLAMSGHRIAATIMLLPAIAPFVQEVIFE